ncbi:MAG: type II secretion system F family protein [Actinobacteria bacterium]|nr:type II secretion system F family protein [Actinomycetota bacterium]
MIVASAGFGTGIVMLWASFYGPDSFHNSNKFDENRNITSSRINKSVYPKKYGVHRTYRTNNSIINNRRLIVALLIALLVEVLTRWPVAAVLAAGAVWILPGLWANTTHKNLIDRIEALGTWTEMLRDTLTGSSGIIQAITATASIAPLAIREEIILLSKRLQASVPLGKALRLLAQELSDPTADMILVPLIMAAESQAQKLGELLSALAESAADEVSMRLRIEARRAEAYTSIRLVVGISIGAIIIMLLFAGSYLSPMGSAQGQLVLGIVGGLYAIGLMLMIRMSRPKIYSRLLEDLKGKNVDYPNLPPSTHTLATSSSKGSRQ